MNPLRMYGNTVQIHRYQISYFIDGEAATEYAHTEEEAKVIADRHSTTYAALDTSDREWMEGLTFPSRDEAIKAYEAGEVAYREQQTAPTIEDRLTALELAQLYSMGVTPNV